jgi:alkylation response protein AidB-like acyl-CoA dehydrogenase
MHSFYFNSDHNLFRKSLRDFLDKEIVPEINKWEEEGRVPKSAFEKMGEMGYYELGMEEKYGGINTDIFYSIILIEELNKCNSGGAAASLLAHSTLAMEHLQKNGNDFLKENYLKPAIQGTKIGCLAITEPNAGSDVASIKTNAQKNENHYVLNGSKTFITNGVYSDFMVVATKTANTGFQGISMMLIDRKWEGVSATPLKKLGWHASDTGEISFDNVKVPFEHLIGEENQGFYYIMQRFELERLVLSTGALASAEYALDYGLKYLSEREAFGRPLSKFQELRHRVAQLSSEIESLKSFNYQICRSFSDGYDVTTQCAMVKLLSTELMDKVSYEVLQFLGGYGYMEEYQAARIFRDSRIGTIGGGTSEIMREIIAKQIIQ